MTAPSTVFPVRKILACVADGPTSDHAVRAATLRANEFDAELDLLHVVAPVVIPGTHVGAITATSLTEKRASATEHRVREHLGEWHCDLDYRGAPVGERLQVVVGDPARIVLERIRDRAYDLVFVGDSGKRKQLDLGGLARALFARAECPVWMQVEPARAIERVLAPVDLSPSSRHNLERAVELAARCRAHVTVMECFVPPDLFSNAAVGLPGDSLPYTLESIRKAERAEFSKFVEEFDWRGVSHSAEFVEDDPARAILAAQDRHDLIVLGTHGRSALISAMLGSVAWQVLRLAHTPVLTLRDTSRRYAF